MTINNSGGVAKYDGLPISTRPAAQRGESLDDIVTLNELETPKRKYELPGNYNIVPAPKYAIEKKDETKTSS